MCLIPMNYPYPAGCFRGTVLSLKTHREWLIYVSISVKQDGYKIILIYKVPRVMGILLLASCFLFFQVINLLPLYPV